MGGAGGGVVGRACTPRLYCRQNLMSRWLLANELLHKTFQLFELWEGEQRVRVTFSQEKMAVGNGHPKRKVNKSVAAFTLWRANTVNFRLLLPLWKNKYSLPVKTKQASYKTTKQRATNKPHNSDTTEH